MSIILSFVFIIDRTLIRKLIALQPDVGLDICSVPCSTNCQRVYLMMNSYTDSCQPLACLCSFSLHSRSTVYGGGTRTIFRFGRNKISGNFYYERQFLAMLGNRTRHHVLCSTTAVIIHHFISHTHYLLEEIFSQEFFFQSIGKSIFA